MSAAVKTIRDAASLDAARAAAYSLIAPSVPTIAVGLGTCGIGNGARELFDAIAEKLATAGIGPDAVRLKGFLSTTWPAAAGASARPRRRKKAAAARTPSLGPVRAFGSGPDNCLVHR